jgi:hypothetical protein
MRTTKQQARVAGLLYLSIGLIAPVGLIYVPGKLIVARDAAATAANLRTSGWLLRLGLASELVHQVIGLFLVLALYRLFKAVDEGLARQMVIFGAVVSVPIVFVNMLNEVAALILVGRADFLTVLDARQRDALAYLFLRLHAEGIVVASVFWGLWLFPLGLLVIRSGFIPRVFGVLSMIAGAAYVASAFATLVVPSYAPLVGKIALPLEVAELPFIFWLVIRGARPPTMGSVSGALTAVENESTDRRR